ncbi:hypothetical protein ACXWTF_10110 [Thiomicrolovo sp. ZZH C-3]
MKRPTLLTCFIKETRWVPTRHEDALRILAEEMEGADPEGLLAYVLEATKRGKTVTVGECRFRQELTGGGPSPSS